MPAYVAGTGVTIQVTALALAVGLVAGLALALARTYGPAVVRRPATIYITLVRALPEMAALFVFFFALGSVFPLSPLVAAVLALSAISGAYQAEIIRGAIKSVGASQMIAARAVGMTQAQAIRFVVLPQAFRFALAPWSNVASGMIKASALIFALGIPELLRQAQYVASRTLDPFTAYGAAALVYLALTASVTWFLRVLEHHFALPVPG